MIDRLKGREVRLTVFRDGKPVDELKPFCDVDFEHDLSRNDYLGKTSDFADVFKGVTMAMEATATEPGAWTKFVEGVVGRARAAIEPPEWLRDIVRAASTKVERTCAGAWLVKGGGGPTKRYSTKALAERAAGPRRWVRFAFCGQVLPTQKHINLHLRVGPSGVEIDAPETEAKVASVLAAVTALGDA